MSLALIVLCACSSGNFSSVASSIFRSSSSHSSTSSQSSRPTPSTSDDSASSSSYNADSTAASVVKITASDNIKIYTIGETFDSLYDMNVTLFYSDGGKKDVSHSPFYFNSLISDAQGNALSSKTPFTTAGTYNLRLQYRGDLSLYSNPMTITVTDPLPVTTLNKKDATPSFTIGQLKMERLGRNYNAMPSLGTVNCLVIPVNVSDYSFSALYGKNYLTDLDRAFNGNGVADTLYWESVASFYQKSSFGKLNLHFDIADVYDPGRSSADLLVDNGIDTSFSGSLPIVSQALDNYIAKHGAGSTLKYDNNHDGFVDGLWLVYSAPDCAAMNYGSKKALFYWAVTASILNVADFATPRLGSFSWASMDFLVKNVKSGQIDAHTMIHETGHLLGLPDYYSYDLSSAIASGPQGGLAMMDLNIGDHDPFSKLALGWNDPYVIEDSCAITIMPSESNGDTILLADEWNGSAFDEYLLLDLVTGTGLNQLDASASYDNRPIFYSNPGIRMMHIDARLGAFKYAFKGESSAGTGLIPYQDATQKNAYLTDAQTRTMLTRGEPVLPSTDQNVPYAERQAGYGIINANSVSRCLISAEPYLSYDELSLIGADNTNAEIDDTYGHDASLFHVGDSWSMARRGRFFFTNEGRYFNNGNPLNWVINVLSCDSNSATIQFRRY